uniref:Uncharacterized protein n=1 Tax=Phocoena sinus TaxID=42100 RepID=A0A8C9BUY2_PHOSS
MGCLGRKTLPFFLIFVPIYLRGALLQETAPERQRKPFLERLCRLEAQFWRFQEATLKHLQGIASNYNLSFVMEAWFWSLAHESQAVALALSQLQATVQGDLGHLKTWVWKTQCRGQKFATWALHSSFRTRPLMLSSSTASSLAYGLCLSAAGSAQPWATWAPSSRTPAKKMTSWFCMAETPCPLAPSTL